MAKTAMISTDKKEYNFIKKAPPKLNLTRTVLIIVGIFLVLVGVLFGIVQPLRENLEAKSKLENAKAELELALKGTEIYDTVYAEYAHYNQAYLTEDEKNSGKVIDYLTLMEYYVFPYSTVTSYSVSSKLISATVINATVDIYNIMEKNIFESGYIKDISCTTFSTQKDSSMKRYIELATGEITATVVNITPDPQTLRGNLWELEQEKDDSETEDGSAEGTEGQETEEEITAPDGEFTVDEIAWQVIRDMWGNGTVRWDLLESRGYDSTEVQSRVDEFCALYNIKKNYTNDASAAEDSNAQTGQQTTASKEVQESGDAGTTATGEQKELPTEAETEGVSGN